MISVNGEIAIVTGSASGIGRAIALRLASLDANVIIADLNIDGARESAAIVAEQGGTAFAFAVDISDIESVLKLRSEVRERWGTPSILVNNAGWDQIMPFLETSPEFWLKVVSINYLGTVAMCHAFLEDMVAAKTPGHIVNVGSDAGRVGSTGETVYAGAKGAVIAFTKSLAREMARHLVTVNCVCPGPTDTGLFAEQPERMREALIKAIPFRRLASVDDIANAVAFFSSNQSSFITGQVLSVSGGLTMAG